MKFHNDFGYSAHKVLSAFNEFAKSYESGRKILRNFYIDLKLSISTRNKMANHFSCTHIYIYSFSKPSR